MSISITLVSSRFDLEVIDLEVMGRRGLLVFITYLFHVQ